MPIPARGNRQQRKPERRNFLDASLVPLENALLHRAGELETANPPDERVDVISLTVAREFRRLAEELHHW